MSLTNSTPHNAVTIFRYQRHPAAEPFPEMDDATFSALADDIAVRGLEFPIILHEGQVLDGWARYNACSVSGIEPRFRDFDVGREGDPLKFVRRLALLHKHYDRTQRAMIVARLAKPRIGFNQYDEGTTIVGAAKEAGVTVKMVERALKVLRKSKIVADAVADGRILTMRVAQKLADLPLYVQLSVLAKGSIGSALKKDIHAADRDWRLAQPVVNPAGRFPVIVADPPWPMDKAPYPIMTMEEVEQDLRRLLGERAASDCILFLWTTQGNLFEASEAVIRLGWQHKFVMIWRKTHGPKNPAGPMYSEEFVVVATKGSPRFADTREFKTGFEGKKGRHSEKPQEFFDLVRRVTIGPRLELYARKRHDGFEPHGNEVGAPQPMGCHTLRTLSTSPSAHQSPTFCTSRSNNTTRTQPHRAPAVLDDHA